MKSIADVLVQEGVVKTNFETPFLWTSGIHSPIYCDCRELISLPEARKAVVDAFLQKIPEKYQAIAGTATAGIPWAAFVAENLQKPMLYVRSKPKAHGAGKMVEGRGVQNSAIAVVEDALSTAGSSIASVKALRDELNAEVAHVFAIFSWDTETAQTRAQEANIELVPLTTFGEICDSLFEHGKISEKEKESLEVFHRDPESWWKG